MVERVLRFLNQESATLQIRKILKPPVIATATVLTLCPMASAQKRWDAPRIVTWSCSGCHGIDGNAQLRYIPRLAGMNAAYAERRIIEFSTAISPPVDELFYRIAGRTAPKPGASSFQSRVNMNGMAHSISTEEAKASAAWYASQKPAPGRSGNPVLIEQGQALFLKGLPAEGLVACQTCHGAQAQGKAQTPGLAGQNDSYVLGELEKFKQGDRKHAPEMTIITKNVETEHFRALAAYVQSR